MRKKPNKKEKEENKNDKVLSRNESITRKRVIKDKVVIADIVLSGQATDVV